MRRTTTPSTPLPLLRLHLPRHLPRPRLPLHTRPSSSSTSTSTTTSSSPTPLTSLLIANRGEIALRILRTASLSALPTTVVYTTPDARSQHALSSPSSVHLGASPTAYLDIDAILSAARRQHCAAIHPGYGFLSENAAFARRCGEAGLVFIGPPWQAIEAMGDKARSKEIMTAAGVRCVPGYHGAEQSEKRLMAEAREIGYPVLLKAVKGGGGKGMRIVRREEEFEQKLGEAKSEARNAFGEDGEGMLVEKYITTPRHIEVQVFADKHGGCVALGERDCSVQRRHQKILEESPAPNLSEEVRQELWAKARAAALAVGYEGAGTVEFIFDNDSGEFFFMEMNTRLQVEHPVTEMITGLDLVQWQFWVAEGRKLPLTQEQVEAEIKKRGWAVEARIYAEDPGRNFTPDSGELVHYSCPPTSDTVRVDSGFIEGDMISSFYDPMISKLIVQGETRLQALQKMRKALDEYEVVGPATNIEFLKRVCLDEDFREGKVETGYIDKHRENLFAPQVLDDKTLSQAALGLVLERTPKSSVAHYSNDFIGNAAERELSLVESSSNKVHKISISQRSNNMFDVFVEGRPFLGVSATLNPNTHILTTFYEDRRLDTRVIHDGDKVDLFERGQHVKLQLALPVWMEKALGIKDVKNSVLAPMPCKILRVEVGKGDRVKKDQALVVIESMKMETVIRSPQDGVISRIAHRAGVSRRREEPVSILIPEAENG